MAETDPSPSSLREVDSDKDGKPSGGAASWLLKSEDLHNVVANQRQTLKDLQDAREQLSALNKRTQEEYTAHEAAFARATRIAQDLQSDMSEIMRRLSVVKTKLNSIKPNEGSPQEQ